MFGVTDKGILVKRQRDVIEDLKERAKPIFQDLVPLGDEVDTSDSSTIGRIIGLLSEPLSDLWELGEEVYNAFDPDSAEGVALDNLVELSGITRRQAERTEADVVVWAAKNTYIPSYSSYVRSIQGNEFRISSPVLSDESMCIGVMVDVDSVVEGTEYSLNATIGANTYEFSKVATSSDSPDTILSELDAYFQGFDSFTTSSGGGFATVENKDIFSLGTYKAKGFLINQVKSRSRVVAVNEGAIYQDSNTINSITTPILGWERVNNPFPAKTGRNRETDEELRERFWFSKFLRGQNISDALYSSLINIAGVSHVRIYENETDVENVEMGLPAHSFKAVVFGGEDLEIAQEIWRNKPIAIGAEGNTEVEIRDSQGFQRVIKFDRPSFVSIEIQVTLRKVSSQFPDNASDLIKIAIMDFMSKEYSVGEDVLFSRLFTPINSVQGHEVVELKIGKKGGTLKHGVNIPIKYNEISSISSGDIEVIILED